MQTLLDLVERHLGASWTQIVEWLRENNSLDEIERRLKAHDIAGVIDKLDDAAAKYSDAIQGGYVEAATQEIDWLSGEVGSVLRFDEENKGAVAWAKENAIQIKDAIGEDTKQTMRQVVADGVSRGANPLDIARDIRDSIGLTPDRAAAVNSYRAALENRQYADALGRQLSDGRSDRTIAAAQRAGRSLTKEQIDQAVERYRQNQITSRAQVIARADALAAAHAGADQALKQAIKNGDVDGDLLVGEWCPGPNTKNARDWHRAADLVAQRPKVGETFVLEDGTEMEHPGDPAGGPINNLGCRCCRAVRMLAAKRAHLDPAGAAAQP